MSYIYTLENLRDEVLNYLDEAGDTGTTKTLVDQLLNQAHASRLSQHPWPFMQWDEPQSFTLTVGERLYTLHPEFWRPVYFKNLTSGEYLVKISDRNIEPLGTLTSSAVLEEPMRFRWASSSPVQSQPAASAAVSVWAASADQVNQVIIKGESDGHVVSETLTLALVNGRYVADSTNSYTKILAVTKLGTWTSSMMLGNTAASVTYLTIPPTESARVYRRIELLTSPTSADTIEYQFLRQPIKLENNHDIPDIPPPHQQILVWDALMMLSGYLTETNPATIALWSAMQQKFETALYSDWLEGQSIGADVPYIRYIDPYIA